MSWIVSPWPRSRPMNLPREERSQWEISFFLQSVFIRVPLPRPHFGLLFELSLHSSRKGVVTFEPLKLRQNRQFSGRVCKCHLTCTPSNFRQRSWFHDWSWDNFGQSTGSRFMNERDSIGKDYSFSISTKPCLSIQGLAQVESLCIKMEGIANRAHCVFQPNLE